jgi:hypothetical protein
VFDKVFARNVVWLLFGHVAKMIQHNYSLLFPHLLDMPFDKIPDRLEILLLEAFRSVFSEWRFPRIIKILHLSISILFYQCKGQNLVASIWIAYIGNPLINSILGHASQHLGASKIPIFCFR